MAYIVLDTECGHFVAAESHIGGHIYLYYARFVTPAERAIFWSWKEKVERRAYIQMVLG